MNDTAELFIDSRCELGEGVFWHPLQERLFWFDILNQTLFSATEGGIMVDRFTFDAPVSAAAIIDADTLAIAAASGLFKLSLSTDARELIVPIEEDKPGNRSNDARVDRSGGFWMGTMSRKGGAEPKAGAVYQYRAGTLTTVLPDITIPNSICFSPDGRRAYFADTAGTDIVTAPVDPATGLPNGPWTVFASTEGMGGPDGAVTDSEGYLWSARWGAGAVVRHAPDGSVDRVIHLPVSQVTCPAFGGKDLKTLYLTSARENLSPEQLAAEPLAGGVFSIRVDVPGLPETLLKL